MTAKELARVWSQMNDADKNWFADNIGEHLERYSEVTSSVGRLGRIDGVDSRAVIDAIDFSCKRIVEA